MSAWPPPTASDGLRRLLGDVHHGWRQEKAKGNAETLTDIFDRAKKADATPEELAQIRSLFTCIAQGLVDQAPRRRRAPWRRNPDRPSGPSQIPAARRPPELPPG